MPGVRLYLASASPRRLALLREAGFDPAICPTGLPEDPLPGERPDEQVLRLARAKGLSAATGLRARSASGVVLAADTAVVLDGVVLGKPADARDAARMLRLLAGRTHEVLTAVFVLRLDDGRSADALERTRVRFRAYDDRTIAEYVASGEPMDKAGAYGIQGLGSRLADRLEGSWSNVVGLPMERLPALLAAVGIPAAT